MKISSLEIFIVFFKIGLILLGGGYVILPILNDELVKKRNWLSEKEVVDYFCIAQCLSGIVAINTTILIGYRLLKFKGVITAVFAIALSPIIIILIIANFLNLVNSFSFIQNIFWGVNLSVIILLYLAIKDVWKESIKDGICFIWFILILILSIKNVSPVLLILSSVFAGIIFQHIREQLNE